MVARRRRDRARGACLALALTLSASSALASGCRSERGSPYDCTCTFVTDFDDESRQRVTVCAADAARSIATARGCAQSGAPGPVQTCSCQPVSPPAACDVGNCALVRDD
ncbi:uncharacterized protein CMC5_061730 [Chondromyces crocatus]|uniref:Secreted protein n=1 Tax=Chondromyces crocatus TaxID=52 RepID=A0A0K1EMB1_CHOCO|nr:uncharacterized protein CMC5_061730 [Chondromyces crocatus]